MQIVTTQDTSGHCIRVSSSKRERHLSIQLQRKSRFFFRKKYPFEPQGVPRSPREATGAPREPHGSNGGSRRARAGPGSHRRTPRRPQAGPPGAPIWGGLSSKCDMRGVHHAKGSPSWAAKSWTPTRWTFHLPGEHRTDSMCKHCALLR